VLEAIRIFIKAAECGSFSKAGTVLGMSPSSVSRQIDKLEKDLETKLFKRSTRHLVLTDSGQSFLERTTKVVSDLDAALIATRSTPKKIAGDLRISVFESFGRLRICPVVPDFLIQHPQIRLELLFDNQLADLYKDEIDLAIRIGRPEDSRLKARKLVTNHMVLCASPDYLAQHGIPTKPHDLADHNCLVLSRSRRIAWWHFRQGEKTAKVQVSGNLTSIGGTPLLEAGIQGVGILMLPEWMVASHINSGALVNVMKKWEPSLYEDGSGDVFAVYLDDPNTKPVIRAFIDHLQIALKQDGLERIL
jgi:DNA-binding transcriptional LysR family regulator